MTGVLNAVLRLVGRRAGHHRLRLARPREDGVRRALGGLGWLARRRLAARRLPVLRWAGIEVAVMAVTIGLAAALTQTAG